MCTFACVRECVCNNEDNLIKIQGEKVCIYYTRHVSSFWDYFYFLQMAKSLENNYFILMS